MAVTALAPLLTPQGQALVDSLPPYDPAAAERLSHDLRRRGHAPDLVSAALTMSRLRERGKVKFQGAAAAMFFTEDGLQQATRPAVADLHASRYVRAGCATVADLTSGIGADALAFARAGLRVIVNDLDPVTAGFAALNLRGHSGVQVVVGDALEVPLEGVDGVFVDPARRNARGRTFNPADFSPPFDAVLNLRKTVPALGVKVAPGIAHAELPADAHAQWVSVEGDLVEAGLWFGPLASAPGRSALVMKKGQVEQVTATTDPTAPVIPLPPAPLGQYFYEPDGAVIRAGALEQLADILGGAPVSDRIAYLSSNQFVDTPLATAFEVVDVLPVKQVGRYLAAREVGSVEILKRGFDVDPDQFRRKLKPRGPNSATIVLTRLEGAHRAVVVARMGG